MSDEKYVTEDELVLALGRSIGVGLMAAPPPAVELQARALLEAARWFRDNEWVLEQDDEGMYPPYWDCRECGRGLDADGVALSPPEGMPHEPECTVGRWARAAERAGL